MSNLSELNPNISLLTWGITVSEMQELNNKYPQCVLFYNTNPYPCLCIDNICVNNFVGDCGTLYINSANNANDYSLALLAEFASLSGFSNILATVCSKNPEFIIYMFLNRGWRIVKNSKSNRNPEKEHYVLLLSIDCVHKGY